MASEPKSLEAWEQHTHTGHAGAHGDLRPAADLVGYLKEYARERPDVAALWCFGLGFVLAWKLKPW